MSPFLGLAAVLVLVIANGFFVASEFSLVAVRRSRVAELVNAGRMNAKALQRAIDQLDANLAATLPENGINHLFRDRSGLVWIASDAVLSYVDPAPRRVLGLVGDLGHNRVAVLAALTRLRRLALSPALVDGGPATAEETSG